MLTRFLSVVLVQHTVNRQKHHKIDMLLFGQCSTVYPTMAAYHLEVSYAGHMVFDFHREMLTYPGIKHEPTLKKT